MTSIKLRNNTYTRDPRLTRIAEFDESSRKFPVTAAISNQTTRSYTWNCSLFLNQGSEGACTGFSLAHELAASPSVVKNVTSQMATGIYYEAQRTDDWPGGEYPGAYPNYSGTSVLASVKAVQALGYIKEYRWAFGLEDLILAVGRKGPAVLGLNWYESMFEPASCGYLHVGGELAGGHAILCKGVNIQEEYFILHNSWGPDWGVNGCAKISFAEMDRLLKEDGEAVIPMSRSVSPIKKALHDAKSLFNIATDTYF